MKTLCFANKSLSVNFPSAGSIKFLFFFLKVVNAALDGFPAVTVGSISKVLVCALNLQIKSALLALTGSEVTSPGLAYLYDAVTYGAVRLPANQQQADYHHHGDGHGHHQQSHHGASVERLQGVGLLWTEMTRVLRRRESASWATTRADVLPAHLSRSPPACSPPASAPETCWSNRTKDKSFSFWDPHLSVEERVAVDEPFLHTRKWRLSQTWCSRIHPQARRGLEKRRRVRTQECKMKSHQSTPRQPMAAAHLSCWTVGL